MKHHGIKIHSAVIGLLVVIAGILLYLFNAELLNPEYKSVIFSWQMLLIAIGFNGLFSRHGRIFGITLILIGGFFLLRKLNLPCLAIITQNGWAIALVFVGLLILSHAIFGKNCCRKSEKKKNECNREKFSGCNNKHKNEVGFVDLNYVFSGTKEKIEMDVFRGGEINCVFGGIELDFSDCDLADGVSTLEINSVFGGSVLYVPTDWNIEVRQDQVFGNFVDLRAKNSLETDKNKTLIIRAASVFGGGEIKCKNQ